MAGHVGIRRYQELIVYVCGESYIEVANKAKSFPMVKHSNKRVILTSKEISEYEYIVGIVQNPYNKIHCFEDTAEIEDLEKVVKKLEHAKDYQFNTIEGQQLKKLCDKYESIRPGFKPLIKNEYNDWAKRLVENYNIEKYNLIKM
jgi:hypothetical protein